MSKIQWNSINENKNVLEQSKNKKKIIHPPRLSRSIVHTAGRQVPGICGFYVCSFYRWHVHILSWWYIKCYLIFKFQQYLLMLLYFFFQSIQLFWYFINVINNQSNTYHNNINVLRSGIPRCFQTEPIIGNFKNNKIYYYP